jgi:hypothetical protein
MRALLLSFLLIGCKADSVDTTTHGDMAKPADMAGPLSRCGHPGDVGNDKGVGKFCTKLSDCPSTASICSSLGNGSTPSADDTYFCTIYPCTPDAGVNDNCGQMASCVCSMGSGGNTGCACTPKSCQ